ncbi:glycosyltransferase family 2 protein [Sediminibacterium sp.]|uniref:glycosyltransferase family 2 protein n=1 Tax=Sediminibacterium sp. TaxID=1917865 RepID=UPI003F6F610A
MTTKLSILIVNYRVYPYLDACLQAVSRALSGLNAEIIIVDNNSEEAQQILLAEKFPGVQWICLKENIGFAKANNLALKKAVGKYILFLNPDTEIQSNVLYRTVDYLLKHPKVGAVGVQMLDGDGCFLPESKRNLPGLLSSMFKLIGLASFFPTSSFFNSYALGHLDKNAIHSVPVLAGAFMMMPAILIKKLKGFDESFFMYGEDIDLSLRVLQQGFENHYLGNLSITHYKGASSKQDQSYLSHFYGSMIIFIKKYPKMYGGALGIWLLQKCIRLFWFIAQWNKK